MEELKSKRSRIPLWVLALVTLPVLLGAAWLAFGFWFPRWLEARITKEAATHGITLTNCSLDYRLRGLSAVDVTLERCQLAASKPVALSGSVARMRIAVVNEAATELQVEGAALKAVGMPDWNGLFEDNTAKLPPYTVVDSQLTWYPDAETQSPAVTLSALSHTPQDDRWTAALDVLGLARGNLLLGSQVELELTLVEQPKTRLRLEVDPVASHATARIDFADLPLARLDGVLLSNLPPELRDVEAEGVLQLDVPYGLNAKQAGGNFRIELKHLNFPVPRELAGLVYAPSATVEGKLKLDRSFTKLTANPVTFTTGQLQMTGRSDFTLDDGSVRLDASMSGALACTAIVEAAAKTHLDTQVAEVASNIVRRALRGNVRIFVLITGSLDDLAQAKIVKGLGVGCGIKPLPLPDLTDFPRAVLSRLPDLRSLPELAGKLPSAADAQDATNALPLPDVKDLPKLPDLSKLPKFELPKLRLVPSANPPQ